MTSDTVSGLTNGTAYTFTVSAMNAVGFGARSPHSNAVTPDTVPGVPVIGTATAGDASATVTWTAPVSDGGSAITGYSVTAADSTTPANGGQTCTWTTGPLTCSVTGLTNGDSYSFTVTATNGVGTGASSGVSNAVTPDTVPGIPVIGTATAGDASATVTWTAPASNGSPITNYDITTYVDGTPEATVTVGAVTSDTVSGLTNGTAYTFAVSAINAVGEGLLSSNSKRRHPGHRPRCPGDRDRHRRRCQCHSDLDGSGVRRWLSHHRLQRHCRRLDHSGQWGPDLHLDDGSAYLLGYRTHQR